MSFRHGLVVLGLAVFTPPAFGAITWMLTLVADNSTPVPGGVGNFRYFSEPTIDGDSIAFIASNDLGSSGVYRSAGGPVERVVDKTTVVPGQAETFGTFGLPVVAAGDLIFTARSASTDGVYRWRDGSLSAIADQSTSLPGVPLPTGYGDLAARGSSIFVQAVSLSSALSIHRIQPAPAETVALAGEAAPGGGAFGGLRRMSTDGTRVAFINENSGRDQWELVQGEPGNLSVIAEPGTVLPNGQLEDFDRRVLQGQRDGRVIFVAKPVGLPESAYVWEAGQVSLAFEGTDSPSGGAPFDDFHFVGLADDAEVVVGRTGLHIRSGDQQVEVFNTLTMFEGRRLAGAVFGPAGVTGRAIALKVYFGDDTEGIMRVDFAVSPPSSGGGGGGAMDAAGIGVLVLLLLAGAGRQATNRASLRTPGRASPRRRSA